MKKLSFIAVLLFLISNHTFSQTIIIHLTNGTIHQFDLSQIDSITFSENAQIISTEELLVKNNEISGWSYTGERWVANNMSELTTHINGMAEVYQRHGFVEAAHQSYQGTIDNLNRLLDMTIFNQGNESNALATYEDPDIGLSGALDWQNGAGQAAHYIRYSGFSQVLTFYRGSYFIYIKIDCDTDESLDIIKQFALTVDGKIK